MPSDIPVFVKILGSKDRSLNAVLGEVKKDLKDTSSEVLSTGLATAAAVGAQAVSLGLLGAKAISVAGSFEGLEAKLKAVLHNGAAAQKVFQDAVTFASVTPFGVDGIVKASVTLTAFGQNAKQVLPSVANLAAAFGQRVEDSAVVLGKAFSGSLEGFESLRNEYGISTALLKQYGAQVDRSTGALKLQGEGLDRARDALQAIIATKYGDATKEASLTLTGALSNVEDGVDRVAASFGKTLLPAATFTARAMGTALEVIEDIPAGFKLMIAGSAAAAAGLATATVAVISMGTAGVGLYAALNALGNRIPALTIPIRKFQDGLSKAATSAANFARASGAILGPVLALTAAFVVAEVALKVYEAGLEATNRKLDEQSHNLQGAVGSFKLYRDAINGAAGGKFISDSKDMAVVAEQVSKAFKAVSTADMVQGLEKAGVTLNDTRKALEANDTEASVLRGKMQEAAKAITDAEENVASLKDRLDNAGSEVSRIQLGKQFEDATARLADLKSEFAGFDQEQRKLASSALEMNAVIQAFERFQKPLSESVDKSKNLETFLNFASKARDAETLSLAAKTVNADLAQMTSVAKNLGLPTDRAGIIEAMVTATGTRLEFLKQELATLERQEDLQTKLLENERSIENERVTQVERRAAREAANRKVTLDGQEEDLQATIKTEKEKLAIVAGSTDEEIALVKKLNALRDRPQTGKVSDQIRDVEARLKVVRQAADQEVAAKNAIRTAEKGILSKSVTDAQNALDEELKSALDSVAELKDAQNTSASEMVAAYDPILQKLEAWKQAHKDLIAQSPPLKKAFEGAVRQVEGQQRQARKEQRQENLGTIKDQISTNTNEAVTNSQKLLALESGIVALQKAKALNLVEQRASQLEINNLKRQEMDLARSIVAEQFNQNVEATNLKKQGIEEEIQILEARQQAGEKVENALKAKRQERLQASLDAINQEYEAEVAANDKNDQAKEFANTKRKAKIESLLRGEYLAAVQQQSQLENAEQAHQNKLQDIREGRLGGRHSPLKSFDEAFSDASSVEFSGVDQAAFGQSALHAEQSPFARKRKFPSFAQFAAGAGFDAQTSAFVSKTLEKTTNTNTGGPTYNVHFNVDAVPPNVEQLARQVANLLAAQAQKKTFVTGKGTPKNKK